MRLKQLDFLRGIAVILVLFRHHWLGSDALQNVGWVGVDLFFVLSGFLVSGLLFSEYKKYGDVRPLRFLIRRGFKIYPMFYLSLAITFVLSFTYPVPDLVNLNAKGRAIVWFADVAFLQNYIGAVWGHHWSLAVEEHFYLAVAATWKWIIKYFKYVVLVFVLCISLRFFTDGWMMTHLRMDSLLMGVCVAYVYHFGDLEAFYRKWRGLLVLLSCLPLMFLVVPFESEYTRTLGFTSLYVSFASLLIVFLYADLERYMLRPVTSIGFYSYGIYLFHLYLSRYVLGDKYLWEKEYVFEWSVVASFAFYFFGAIGLGMLMSYLIEKPFLALRDKWFPRRDNRLDRKGFGAPRLDNLRNSTP